MIVRYLPKNTEEFVGWYERYISPAALVAGFLADNLFLLRRVDLIRSNALLLSYLVVCAFGIIVTNFVASGRVKSDFVLRATPILYVVMQFAFGGLFSGYLSLYSRSASVATSWIFVLVLAGLLLGNERFIRFYRQFTFQVSLYFTCVFSFLIFFLPVIFHSIGNIMFLISGFASLVLITLFLSFLNRIVPEIEQLHRTHTARSIGVIFVVFNVLYFNNLIPPLPLALKSAGIYHAIIKSSDGYVLSGEVIPWYESFLNYNTQFHIQPGETAYVYTAIFAPSGLSVMMYHEWQQYDDVRGVWHTVDTLDFPIIGGRDGGYRGFTTKTNIPAGAWRVNVLTQSGRLVGRVSFVVISVSSPAILVSETQ